MMDDLIRMDVERRMESTAMLSVRLADLRRDRGFTQERVAQLSGVGAKTISSYETGERISTIKLAKLVAILAVYDVTLAAFFAQNVEQSI